MAAKTSRSGEGSKSTKTTKTTKTTRTTGAAKATRATRTTRAKKADEKPEAEQAAAPKPEEAVEPAAPVAADVEPEQVEVPVEAPTKAVKRKKASKQPEPADEAAASEQVEAPAEPEKAAKPEAVAEPEEAVKPEAAAEPEEAPEPVEAAVAEAEPESVEESVEPAVEPEAEPAAEPEPEPAAEPEAIQEPEEPAVAEDEPVAEESPEPQDVAPDEPEPKPEPVIETPEFADVPGVLIAAAECAPLVKVGGLADVVGALPKYLKKLGIDARIIMPFHRQIKDRYATQTQHLFDFQARMGWRSQFVGIEKLELDGTIYYFVDNEFYFGGPIYCGGEFEGEQYAFFTRAVMDSIPLLDFDVRILHCNDWHTAMMPLLAKTQYQGGMQSGLRTILTIHNLHFQGQFSHEFDRDLLGVDDSLATPQFVEHYGCDNMLKAGIVFADKVNTVSPTYAREICESDLGESLEGVLRSRGSDLSGILNGLDVDIWNPSDDPCLPMNYSAKSLWRKAKDREALLEELGLAPAGPDTPVISMVGRLTPQKGIDLVRWGLEEIMAEDVRVIILGSGDADFENSFREAEGRHKGKLCSYIGYNGDLSHRIYAGSDLFLMPSLFEPCGISQMIAMRYGTLPIVRETGGLKDTVVAYNQYTGEGNGFSFAHYDAGEMLGCIRYALYVWRDPDARKRLIEQAMACDFSFDRCARSYAELYRSVL